VLQSLYFVSLSVYLVKRFGQAFWQSNGSLVCNLRLAPTFTQCGNLKIFPTLYFYVKSLLIKSLEVVKMCRFWHFWRGKLISRKIWVTENCHISRLWTTEKIPCLVTWKRWQKKFLWTFFFYKFFFFNFQVRQEFFSALLVISRKKVILTPENLASLLEDIKKYKLWQKLCYNQDFTWNQFWLISEGQKLLFWPF